MNRLMCVLLILCSSLMFAAPVHTVKKTKALVAHSLLAYSQGRTLDAFAEVAVIKGMAVSLDTDGTNTLVYPAYSNNPANTMVSGIALNDASIGDPVTIQVSGIVEQVAVGVDSGIQAGSTLAVYSSQPGISLLVGGFNLGDVALIVGTAITNPTDGYVRAVISFSVLPTNNY